MDDYWLKQTMDKPLFEDIIWSKPENKMHAGKLLIVGGSTNGFAHTVDCYSESQKAGAGVVKVIIPDSTKKLIGNWSEDIIFANSTKSGGFGKAALAEILESANWADLVLISGELGNNSETTILFEKFFEKYKGPLTIADDAFEFCEPFLEQLLSSNQVTSVLDISKLQKLSKIAKLTKPITSTIALVNLVELLNELSEKIKAHLVIEYSGFIIVSSQGFVSTTKLINGQTDHKKLTANAAVWFMQNPSRVFEALTCSAISCQTD